MFAYYPLYIDPGTGSMLFSVVVGVAATLIFAFRALFIKLKVRLSGGKADTANSTRIPFLIFSDHKRYWNIFKPICDEFEKRGAALVYWTASSADPALSEKYEHVKAEFFGERNRPSMKLNFASADICVATTPGLDVLQWKRSKMIKHYVHVPHTVDDLSGYRMFGLDYYDSVLTTGQNQVDLIRKIESLRPAILKKELVCVGSPNLDAMSARLKNENANPSSEKTGDKKVVLVAPSWGKSGILSRYGEKFLSELVKTGFEIIVRPHPQTVVSEQDVLKPLQEKFPQIEWNFDNDNFSVLKKSDILITDFSGIIFDYSLVFDKPLIYADTDFDTLPYDADWLDEPMWSFRVLPKIGIQLKQEDFCNLNQIINQAIESQNMRAERDAVRSECWQHRDESAKLIVDYLIDKQKRG